MRGWAGAGPADAELIWLYEIITAAGQGQIVYVSTRLWISVPDWISFASVWMHDLLPQQIEYKALTELLGVRRNYQLLWKCPCQYCV